MAEPVGRHFATPISAGDILRYSVLELAAMVKEIDPLLSARADRIIRKLEALDALNHVAIDDGTGHCTLCGKVVQISTTHIWPLRD